MQASPTRTVVLLCAAEALSMAAFSTYPALLPSIRDAWRLNNASAGLVSGVYFGGYMAAVPLLTGLTDRVDARRVYALSALVASAGAFGFALFARGLVSALVWQALAGAGLAGTYMPGLKALADRVEGPHQSRAISFYTSTFGLGGSFSLWLAGATAGALGWRGAFAVAAAGPLAAAALVAVGLAPRLPAPAPRGAPAGLARLTPVVRDRAARRYIVRYAVHCWELFGVRAWMVAFLVFAAARTPGHPMPWAAATVAAAINLLGPPASILGNEAAARAGRLRYVSLVMAASSVAAMLVGFTSAWSWTAALAGLTVYFVIVMADSAALTAGVVAAAPAEARGATMAVYSLAGFGAAFVAPLVFGAMLDATGGATPRAWAAAFASLAVPTALVLALAAATRTRKGVSVH